MANYLNFWPWVSQKWVTNMSDITSKLQQQITPTVKSGGLNLFDTANADSSQEQDIIQTYLNDENEKINNRKEIQRMLSNWENKEFIKNTIIKTLWYTWPKIKEQKPSLTWESQTWWDIWLNIAWNIFKWVENLWADVINIWSKSIWSDYRVKPLREQLFNTWEEYKWWVTQDIANIIQKRWEKLADISWNREKQTQLETSFQIWTNIWAWVYDVIWTWFMAWLSTLTPDKQKKELTNLITQATQTEWWQFAIEKAKEIKKAYEDYKKENPRGWRNISAVLDTLNIISNSWIIKIWDKTIKAWINKTSNLVDNWINKVWQWVNTFRTEAKELVNKWVNKWKDLVTPPPRSTEDITANILQPYKWMTENLTDANLWLRRVIDETWTKVNDYKTLSENVKITKDKYWKILDESLGNIKWNKYSESSNTALTQLWDLYKWTQSKASNEVLKRINELKNKNQEIWLTAKEMQEIKVLHTEANNLFNEKWQATWWFLADDLRSVRNELKTEIEDFWSSQWVTNIKDINKVYWELLNTESLLKNQQANLMAYKWRALPTTTWEKIGWLIGKISVIKWWLQWFAKETWISLKAWKIDVIEVQKRLPKLLEELKKSWVKEWQLKQIEVKVLEEINKTNPNKQILNLPPWKKQPIITQQTIDNWIIQESKQDIKNAKINIKDENIQAQNYDLAKQSISDYDDIKKLTELKEDIKDLWLAKEKELLDEIDTKVEWLKELNKLWSVWDWLYNKYGKDLIESFKILYKNEIRNKTRWWADKYSKVEFQNTPAFTKFKDSVAEYLDPWDNKTVQEVYDDIKWQLTDIEKVKDINISKEKWSIRLLKKTKLEWQKEEPKLLKKEEPKKTPLLKKENLEKAKDMFKKEDDLVKEAKKYKNADEFVKANKKMTFEDYIEERVKKFWEEERNFFTKIEDWLYSSPRYLNINTSLWLENAWFYFVTKNKWLYIYKDISKTEAQLKDIYNKANPIKESKK